MAQQAERGRPQRPLVECSSLYSNYFAYTLGGKGSGIDLYRIARPSSDAGADAVGMKGSITDRPETHSTQQPYRIFADSSPANSGGVAHATTASAAPTAGPGFSSPWPLGGEKGTAASDPRIAGGASAAGSAGGSVGGGCGGGGGGGGGHGGYPGGHGYENPFVGGPDFADSGGGAAPAVSASATYSIAAASGGVTAGGVSRGASGGSVAIVVGGGGVMGGAGGGVFASTGAVGAEGQDGVSKTAPSVGGGGDFPGYTLGPRRASLAFSEPGNARGGGSGSGNGGSNWSYRREGGSTLWHKPKAEDQQATCMRWFPHRGGVGTNGMETADMQMLAVGYASGKVGLVRFSDEKTHGESVCVIAAASKNRPCNAVAWDPSKPSRLAAGWAKSRHNCVGVYDVNYIEQWQRGVGEPSAQAAASAGATRATMARNAALPPPGAGPASSASGNAGGSAAPFGSASAAAAAAGSAAGGSVVGSFGSSTSGLGGMASGMASLGLGESAGGDDGHGGDGIPGGGGGWGGGGGGADMGFSGLGLTSRAASSYLGAVGVGGGSIREGGVSVWPVAKGNSGWDTPMVGSKSELIPNDSCHCLAWIPGEDSVLLAGTKFLRIADLRVNVRGASMRTVDVHGGGGVSGIAFRPTNPTILATWSDTLGEPVKMWDVRKLQDAPPAHGPPNYPPVAILPSPAGSSVIDVAWCPDRPDILATVHSDNPRRVCLWDVWKSEDAREPRMWDADRRKVPSDYRYTKDPISSISWQPRGLTPRPTVAIPSSTPWVQGAGAGGEGEGAGGGDTAVAGTAGTAAGAGWGLPAGGAGGKRTAEAIATALAEDERVTARFPNRLLTASAKRPLIENLGPMEKSAVHVSCHGDVARTLGFCVLEGTAERSGFLTRVDDDAFDGLARRQGSLDHVMLARKAIARSRKRPDIAEVMKWRAQAGYMHDPIHNLKEIFSRELADQMEASSDMDNNEPVVAQPTAGGDSGAGTPTVARASSAAATAASAASNASIATTDIRSGCRLWRWVARIDELCDEARRRETAGAGPPVAIGGRVGPSFMPASVPVRPPASARKTEWDRSGLADAGVMDILAEEFEPPPTTTQAALRRNPYGSSRVLPSSSEHPTLGCSVYSSPARELAIRACGWGASVESAEGAAGGSRDRDLTSGSRWLNECPGVPDGLGERMAECEEVQQYERSAALAVFHGDLGAAIKALRRAKAAVQQREVEKQHVSNGCTALAATSASGKSTGPNAVRASFGQASPARSGIMGGSGIGVASDPVSPPVMSARAVGGAQGPQEPKRRSSAGKVKSCLWTDAAALEQLLYMTSVCISCFRPPPNTQHQQQQEGPTRGDSAGSGTAIYGDDDGAGPWRELSNELLERKELRGSDAPGAYLRACCIFLDSILAAAATATAQAPDMGWGLGSENASAEGCAFPEALPEAPAVGQGRTRAHPAHISSTSVSAYTSGAPAAALVFEQILRDRSLSLADRTAVACMFLPPAQLKAFLTEEADRCVSGGYLEGALLVGMAPRGIKLLQAYVDRTSDVQTAALVSCRAAVVYPLSWEEEKMQVAQWVETYRRVLFRWQFFIHRAKFTKFYDETRDRLEEHPLSPEAVSRLKGVKLPRASRSPHDIPPEGVPAKDGSFVGPGFPSATSGAASALVAAVAPTSSQYPAAVSRNRHSGRSMGSYMPATSSVGGSIAAVLSGGRTSYGANQEDVAGGRDVAPKRPVVGGVRWDRIDGGRSFNGFGGGVAEPKYQNFKCILCKPGGGGGEAAEAAGDGGKGPTPIVNHCASCTRPLPRCYICLHQMDSADPDTESRRQYFDELKRPGAVTRRTSGGGGGGADGVDNAQPSSPVVSMLQFMWCNECSHGGHVLHLNMWFETHDECGMKGCRCKCRSLDRPVLSRFTIR